MKIVKKEVRNHVYRYADNQISDVTDLALSGRHAVSTHAEVMLGVKRRVQEEALLDPVLMQIYEDFYENR